MSAEHHELRTTHQSIVDQLNTWFQRLTPSETHILIASGLLVGIGAGLGAVVFRYLIEGFDWFFFDFVKPWLAGFFGSGAIIFIPALGGLIFGPLIYRFAREAKGHGVPEVMFAVAEEGGRIRPRVAVVKSLASALCIGSGGSVGREGPIVQIGSALGSALGQVTKASAERNRTLVACGAAGGIAATFNAPIAGVFFALEVILGEFSTRAFGTVVLASVAASVIGRTFFGDVPGFIVPEYELATPIELVLFAILAVCAGLVGVMFTKVLYWFEDVFDAIRMREYLKPLPGGLILGSIAVFVPEILGVGYGPMESALTGQYTLMFLVAVLVVKVIAVSVTIGSGGSGGVFAPSLFIGCMLGTAFGTAAQNLMPTEIGPAGAYGLVGMAALFAGSARAPITAVIILFELSGDYRIILPLMGAVVISTFVSEAVSKDTIYTLKLRRRGIQLDRSRDTDLLRQVPVRRAMSATVPTLPGTMSIAEAARRFDEIDTRAVVILDDFDHLDAILTSSDMEEALLENQPGTEIREVATRPVITEYDDAPLGRAVQRMSNHDIGQLPIVKRGDPRTVVGLLRRGDIVRAYSSAALDRLQSVNGKPVPLQMIRGTQIVEYKIPAESSLVGRKLHELALPGRALIIAIERDGVVSIPGGNTELIGGDRLQILVEDIYVGALHSYVSTAQAPERSGQLLTE
ncbi:MAG: chloride channel protein [Thermomicrobiales bacterium]